VLSVVPTKLAPGLVAALPLMCQSYALAGDPHITRAGIRQNIWRIARAAMSAPPGISSEGLLPLYSLPTAAPMSTTTA
jgi:hypothetical protein